MPAVLSVAVWCNHLIAGKDTFIPLVWWFGDAVLKSCNTAVVAKAFLDVVLANIAPGHLLFFTVNIINKH